MSNSNFVIFSLIFCPFSVLNTNGLTIKGLTKLLKNFLFIELKDENQVLLTLFLINQSID
jgi:hypothetical protein